MRSWCVDVPPAPTPTRRAAPRPLAPTADERVAPRPGGRPPAIIPVSRTPPPRRLEAVCSLLGRDPPTGRLTRVAPLISADRIRGVRGADSRQGSWRLHRPVHGHGQVHRHVRQERFLPEAQVSARSRRRVIPVGSAHRASRGCASGGWSPLEPGVVAAAWSCAPAATAACVRLGTGRWHCATGACARGTREQPL